jgi:hypothetical protein
MSRIWRGQVHALSARAPLSPNNWPYGPSTGAAGVGREEAVPTVTRRVPRGIAAHQQPPQPRINSRAAAIVLRSTAASAARLLIRGCCAAGTAAVAAVEDIAQQPRAG